MDRDSIVRIATDSDLYRPCEDDSETIPDDPRRTLIVALARVLDDATAVGDLALARFAADLLSLYSV